MEDIRTEESRPLTNKQTRLFLFPKFPGLFTPSPSSPSSTPPVVLVIYIYHNRLVVYFTVHIYTSFPIPLIYFFPSAKSWKQKHILFHSLVHSHFPTIF